MNIVNKTTFQNVTGSIKNDINNIYFKRITKFIIITPYNTFKKTGYCFTTCFC